MLDIRFIKENSEAVRLAIAQKGAEVDLDRLLHLSNLLSERRQQEQTLSAERNKLSRAYGSLDGGQQVEGARAVRALNDELRDIRQYLSEIEAEFRDLMLRVPNIPAPDAPIGRDESENIVVREWGKVPDFDFDPRDHVDLIRQNGWGDSEKLGAISGSRTYMLSGTLARLEVALWSWALDKLSDNGFNLVNVPSLAREEAFVGTGHLPGSVQEIYKLPEDELYLSGTAEVVINSLHSGEILEGSRLPVMYAGWSPCFRREAGSAGRDVRGLLRVHQFAKVEQYIICEADPVISAQWHNKLLLLAEEILQELELPYRVVECCTGDMGLGKVRMHDIETWIPSLSKYRETHSCSTLHDWQARRTNVRYKPAMGGKPKFVHTLNNTAIATPRILAPLLEVHQTSTGRVRLPKVLQSYMNGKELL